MFSILLALVIITAIAWLVYKAPEWLRMEDPFKRIIQVVAIVGGILAAIYQLLSLV